MGLHGTLLEGVPWPLECMGLHGTLLKEVPWPIEGMGHHGTLLKEDPKNRTIFGLSFGPNSHVYGLTVLIFGKKSPKVLKSKW